MAFEWCKNEIHHRMSFQLAFHRFQTTKHSENPSINLQKGCSWMQKSEGKGFLVFGYNTLKAMKPKVPRRLAEGLAYSLV